MGTTLFMRKLLGVGRLVEGCPDNPYRQIAAKKSLRGRKCFSERHRLCLSRGYANHLTPMELCFNGFWVLWGGSCALRSK
jgi:hypothetical protein